MKHLPRWKREQIGIRRKKFIDIFRFVLLVFGVILFLVGGLYYFFYRSQSVFNNLQRVNLVIFDHEITFFSISMAPKAVTIITIPSSVSVSLPSPYGQYRIGVVPELDSSERKGGRLLEYALTSLVGVPIDKMVFNNSKVTSFQSLSDIKKYFGFGNFFFLSTTNSFLSPSLSFSPVEALQLWFFIKTVKPSFVHFVQLDKTGLVRSEQLADGSFIQTVDIIRFDDYFEKSFFEKGILDDHFTIGIQNASDINGIGNWASRLVTNIGDNVVSISKSDSPIFDNAICYQRSSYKKSYTVLRLQKIFHTKAFICPEEQNARTDIILVLGKNFSPLFR